jgi:putative hydrolase of the HAD superfamily
MRKPDPAIFNYTLRELSLPATQCAFIDDLLPNVRAAADLGLVAIHHSDYATTAAELDVLFGVPLSQ